MSPEVRLQLLRENDRLREWHALSKSRVCVPCGRRLTGRTIVISRTKNRIFFRCPTPGCVGSLDDFAAPGDPLLDDNVWQDWERTLKAREFADDADSISLAHEARDGKI